MNTTTIHIVWITFRNTGLQVGIPNGRYIAYNEEQQMPCITDTDGRPLAYFSTLDDTDISPTREAKP